MQLLASFHPTSASQREREEREQPSRWRTIAKKLIRKEREAKHALEHARQLRVDVIDRGHGIPQSVRDSLFNPFFTTKSGGMGMGLAISQTIVKSHGGTLGFEDNPGGGTTFYVTLPTKVA